MRIVVVRRVGGFDHRGPGTFRAWLRGIVANRTRDYFRARREEPAVNLDQLASDDTSVSRLWEPEHDEYLVARAMAVVEGDFAPATWRAFHLQAIGGRPPAVPGRVPAPPVRTRGGTGRGADTPRSETRDRASGVTCVLLGEASDRSGTGRAGRMARR